MGVFKLKSEASYRSRGIDVRAKVSVTIRWRNAVQRRSLTAELATYTSPSELLELEAMLERYDDGETEQIRSILATQAASRRFAQCRGPLG
ncbi:MAG TPA: hypothetical protein VGE11_13470 [Pseudonocardia sp.]